MRGKSFSDTRDHLSVHTSRVPSAAGKAVHNHTHREGQESANFAPLLRRIWVREKDESFQMKMYNFSAAMTLKKGTESEILAQPIPLSLSVSLPNARGSQCGTGTVCLSLSFQETDGTSRLRVAILHLFPHRRLHHIHNLSTFNA